MSSVGNIANEIHVIREDLAAHRRELLDHVKDENVWREKIEEQQARYQEFLDMLIEREKARARIRQAVIEKSLAGLIWAVIAFVGTAAWQWVQARILHQ